MRLPRVMTAAVSSGSGKTILTCGMLEALKRRGTDVRSFKCGPDYIDPMFHRRVTGAPCGNIDTFFSSAEEIRGMLCRSACEAAVIEGVMGIYDGAAGLQGRGSCYDAAAASGTPVLLIADVKGMGLTMLSVIKGILSDDRENLIRGIILNRITPIYLETIRPQLDEMLSCMSADRNADVKLLGGIPGSKAIQLESRHLGLSMPFETDDLEEQLKAAADLIEEHLDMDALLEIMEQAEELPDATAEPRKESDCGLVLAVARDEAFCFCYEENLRIMEEAGISIREFSPVHDARVPQDADGLLLGGGYPELYAEELSGNTSMLSSVREAIDDGMPSLAECGGFMYLLESLEDMQGRPHEMAGALEGGSHYTGKLSRFGYVTLREKKHLCAADTLITGLEVKGHEFHYFDSDNNGSNAVAEKPGSGRTWECMHADRDHLWGYPHLWYPSCPELVRRFAAAMEEYRRKKQDG
ncbi:MAG: cobyrinate a,c-diamide synthase [Mogibacterium sp.]|nr:cobyrinate a,c-diamide synthase [Mogibacterium sp.]